MNPKKKMLTLKPGKTNSVLLLTMLLLAIQSVIAHPADSLLNKLSRTKKPDQQISLLHQLYEHTRFENTHEAEKYMMSAIDIGMKTSNTVSLITSYRQLASLYEQQRNYMQAHLFYQEAQKTAVESDNAEILPELNYHIGVALCRLDRFAEAITYLQHASLSSSPKQQELSSRAALFQAFCYLEADQENKALQQIDSLISVAKKMDNQALLSFYHYELQHFWHHRKEGSRALPLNDAAIQSFMEDNEHHYAILAMKERAEIYQSMDSTNKAIDYLRRALNGINSIHAFNYLKPSILDGLAICYRKLNDNILSQSYERQSKLLRDSMSLKGKTAIMPIQSVSYPGVLPYKKTSTGGLSNWQSRLVPLLLLAFVTLSAVIWLRYRKIKANISEEKASALLTARQVAEQEKQIALREAYEQLEKEKENAAFEARGLVEKVREEARSLQAQIATTSVLLANKTEYLQQLQEKLYTSNNEDCRRFAKEIKSNIGDNDHWGEFIRNFNLLHQHTIDKITKKHPDLTPNEVKLTCFVLSGMNNKEIAGIFSVEPESVKKARYRLKKKLRLTEEESLRGYLEQLQ
jgi:tetratricopeptide (TPR) repeat protein